MTPAIKLLEKKGIKFQLHRYDHDPECQTYGEEAADKLNLDPARVLKTLVAQLDGNELAVAIVPVSTMLDLKALAKESGAKKARMADKKEVERTTGYIVGGVSPIGQKKRLRALIDSSALQFATVLVSGGKRGLDIELAPQDLSQLIGAGFAEISKR